MGAFLSYENKHPPPSPFLWSVPDTGSYHMSPVFTQESESFAIFVNQNLSQITIYCCSAAQWQFDEIFVFSISLQIGDDTVDTSAAFTHNRPFCAITLDKIASPLSTVIRLCSNYPYTRKARHLGILNSGATCYMATIVQMLFHTGSFRQLLYSFKDAPAAPAALQNLFVELELSSRAPPMDAFIRSLGSFRDLALVQNDAHEFLIGLLERFEKDLGEEFKSGVDAIFRGRMAKVIECEGRGIVSQQTEDFLAVPVVVEGLRSLAESLTLSTATETVDEYELDDGTRVPAEKRSYFVKLPPILIFQLCRFTYNAKTNTVVELRNAFDCPFELNMADFTRDWEGVSEYELYGITAHSGNPVFGHYTSYFRPNMAKQWVLFNDGSTKNANLDLVQRLFGTQNAAQPSFFKAFSFTTAVAYMLYYVRKDCENYVAASESIPLHLVPHRSNLFFSRFVFSDDFSGKPLQPDFPPHDWEDPQLSISDVLHGLYPDKILTNLHAWVQMPGKSQFLGPVPLSIRAAKFVVKGHATNFFITPKSISQVPIFLATDKPPRMCLGMTECADLKCPEEYEPEYQTRKLESVKYIAPGSVVLAKSIKNVVLKFGRRRFVFPHDATYNDVQKRLALFFEKPPNRILILNGIEPMLPIDYPYIRSFPANNLSFQFLEGDVTVCSIQLFVQLTLTYVSPVVVQRYKEPYWLEKGKTCKDLIDLAPKLFPQARQNENKFRIEVSVGKQSWIDRFLSPKQVPPSQKIRFDLVRYEVATTRGRLKTMLNKGIPMSIEVRFTRNKEQLSFEGTSRMITVTKTTLYRELCEKMMRASLASLDTPTCAIMLVSEKPKIRMELADDDNLFDIMKRMTRKMTKQQQRLVVALVAENPLLMKDPAVIPRSLSAILSNKDNLDCIPETQTTAQRTLSCSYV